ncbi:hypothetical protein ACPYPG_24125 [Streptomyces sp. FR-108]
MLAPLDAGLGERGADEQAALYPLIDGERSQEGDVRAEFTDSARRRPAL